MNAVLAAFALGVLALQVQPALPAPAASWLAPACVALALWRRALAVPAACAIGFLWAAGLAQLRVGDWLAPELEGRDLEVVGVVASLPAIGERSVRFDFEVESAPQRLPGKMLLTWYRSLPDSETDAAPQLLDGGVHPGERWRFVVRLRRPHGQLNPHGFDYEAWLLERGIGATGYVRPRNRPLRLGRRDGIADRIEQIREAVRDRFSAVLGATPAAGILTALAVGDQRAIASEEWRLFNRTGVTHLMSISGLHVTMISGLFAGLVAFAWRRIPALALRLPARLAAAPAAILAAGGYALVSGFAVPAQRTFWMVAVVALALWFGRIVAPLRTLLLALVVVVALDPWAVLAPGFWLSFGAVALIFYVAATPGASQGGWRRLRRAAQVQWAITVGLAPATLFLFSQVSLAGPLANAVAIPAVSAVITPLALLAAVLPVDGLLFAGAWLTEQLLQFLEACAMLPAALWQQHAPPLWSVLLALGGVLWLVAPRGVPWRAAGVALVAPAFALPAATPPAGEAWITTLDVGQGLAAVVRTAGRTLLYDAGPQFGADADSGERIVTPFLRAVGVPRIDALVVTHNDTDHSGGAASVIGNLEVDAFLSSLPASHPLLALAPDARPCRRGAAWEWDGVRFELLHPGPEPTRIRKANNRSCVLRVAAGAASMLLTGDIEFEAEQALLAQGTPALRSDVLLAPHHGSESSSSPEFLAAVAPALVVVPAGYRNRFGHPSPLVLARYGALEARVLRTDLDGAVSVRLGPGGIAAWGERADRPRYWRNAVPRS